VIDHFDFSREIVSISIHYLDRYLATRPVNKKLFQLAAMTTLYLAIKLYEPGSLSMASMIELSRGYFKVEQMAEMEMTILR
jgi:lipoyl(octanoyl) transferase